LVEQARERVFGLPDFRPGQRDAIDALLAGRDLLAVMPTGAGKSLCFQLPAVVHNGLTLVVSPLIALMKDQVDGLQRLGVRAAYLASGQSAEERRGVLRDVRAGRVDLLYVSPERLREQSFLNLLEQLDVWLVAVDEAHCISAWGMDFRPDYLRIPEALRRLPRRPVIAAFTATAPPEVRTDLIEQLRLDDPARVLAGFDRPNLRFLVKFCAKPSTRLRELSREVGARKGSGIIYAGTRKAAEEQAAWLRADGRKAEPYHAGLPPDERSATQDAFLSGQIDVICATNAFGLGIDKPDTRFVIHTALPPALDAYYQEAGRAGRDGMPADALMLYCRSDRQLQEWLIDADLPRLNDLRQVYELVARSGGELDLAFISAQTGLSETTLRVALQALAESRLIETGERSAGRLEVAAVVDRVGHVQALALEQALARQRNRRVEQLEAMIAYAEGSGCRRETLLEYLGDPDAAPGNRVDCCDRCADPTTRSAGDLARRASARKLRQPGRLSPARRRIRDTLAQTGDIRAAAQRLEMSPKDVGEQARNLVKEGHLPVDAVVPAYIQEQLALACERMDEAGIDYRRPRPGYLQTAMRYCRPGTSWDHLALYLAHLRRDEAIAGLDDVPEDEEPIEREPEPKRERTRRVGLSDTARESLQRFQAGASIAEIADERELRPATVEGHLVMAYEVGELEFGALVDDATAELVRRAIAETPPSETPLRDIRAYASAIAGRGIPYLAINAVHAQQRRAGRVSVPDPDERVTLQRRKSDAERLRAERTAAGKPWPSAWETEYQRILARIAELE
jgi:ATP-dependent DNA helicase RecQ